MNFLQPWMVFGLPLVLLPIVIHLIHRRRQRVVEWGAMRFLLARSKLSRGLQKLRHFLILACRVLAVLTLVFALGRPMTGGWLGSVAGAGADTVVVILDRSASMATLVQGRSRLETGVARLVETLEVVHSKHWLCLDGATGEFVDVKAPRDLLRLPAARPTATHADMPALFETAITQIEKDRGGRAEIWVCSDLQATDWNPTDGRWTNIGKRLAALEGTTGVHLLALAEPTPTNLAVRVLGVEFKKRKDAPGGDLALDVQIVRDEPTDETVRVPLVLAFGSGRSVVELELHGSEARNEGLAIPLASDVATGFGSVELPADDGPQDNAWYVTFGTEPVRRSVVVTEDEKIQRILVLAAEAPLRDGVQCAAVPLPIDRAAELDLAEAALLVWQGPLPRAGVRERIEAFVRRGGRVLFLPPRRESSTDAFAGLRWGEWIDRGSEHVDTVATWREDTDLLANTGDGRALPLGRVEVYGLRELHGDGTALARLQSERPLLLRAPTETGGVYFLATDPLPEASNLARQGILLVALVQRALEDGVRATRPGLQSDAGMRLPDTAEWQPVLGAAADAISTERSLHAGVIQRGNRAVALNRPIAEDAVAAVAPDAIRRLFEDSRVEVSINDGRGSGALVEEVWKLFLLIMVVALIGEAVLSLVDLGGAKVRST